MNCYMLYVSLNPSLRTQTRCPLVYNSVALYKCEVFSPMSFIFVALRLKV